MDVACYYKMKIVEIIFEGMRSRVIHPEHADALNNARTYPDQNTSTGKLGSYGHWKYGIALAGAGAGDTPDNNMPDHNFMQGDPLFAPYHPLEKEMLDRAAKHIGDHSVRNFSGPSGEHHLVNIASPSRNPGPIKRKTK
jgi:hypothetical protein